jgi:hypothetical protein
MDFLLFYLWSSHPLTNCECVWWAGISANLTDVTRIADYHATVAPHLLTIRKNEPGSKRRIQQRSLPNILVVDVMKWWWSCSCCRIAPQGKKPLSVIERSKWSYHPFDSLFSCFFSHMFCFLWDVKEVGEIVMLKSITQARVERPPFEGKQHHKDSSSKAKKAAQAWSCIMLVQDIHDLLQGVEAR